MEVNNQFPRLKTNCNLSKKSIMEPNDFPVLEHFENVTLGKIITAEEIMLQRNKSD